MEADNRVVGMERLFFVGELVELPQDVAEGHARIMLLWPRDHPLEETAFFQPLMSNIYERLVVRHQNAAELRGLLEVLRIQSIFRKSIDTSNNVPACSPKSFYENLRGRRCRCRDGSDQLR